MHKEFYSFVSTLPNPLGKQEQEFLLYEMSKLKDELDKNDDNEAKKKYYEIREKLISTVSVESTAKFITLPSRRRR